MIATRTMRAINVRSFSSVVAESPRMTIAKNIMRFKEIAAANSEASLAAASKVNPVVNLGALPAELDGLQGYLSSAAGGSTQKFVKDPNVWQNMPLAAYITTEASRDNTWPFVVGGVVTFLLLGVMLPSALPESGKANSKYISMIEGRHGKLAGDHH